MVKLMWLTHCPSAYVGCFYHRELRGHGEAIAAAILLLSSVTSLSSVVQILFLFPAEGTP